MLHLLYILAFTVLAVLAVTNMVRNLINLQATDRRMGQKVQTNKQDAPSRVPHPELLDESGQVIDEPLLVMKSISIRDAREQLDAMYESSSGSSAKEDKDDGSI